MNHGNVSNISSHDVCVVCHGMKESATGGSFSPVVNYALFDDATDANGDHWNGNINMNSDTEYNETNFGCDAAAWITSWWSFYLSGYSGHRWE